MRNAGEHGNTIQQVSSNRSCCPPGIGQRIRVHLFENYTCQFRRPKVFLTKDYTPTCLLKDFQERCQRLENSRDQLMRRFDPSLPLLGKPFLHSLINPFEIIMSPVHVCDLRNVNNTSISLPHTRGSSKETTAQNHLKFACHIIRHTN